MDKSLAQNIDLEKLSSVSLYERALLPKSSGVYLVIDDKGVVQYIGRAVDIHKRWLSHHHVRELELSQSNLRIAWILMELPLLYHVELALIHYFLPPLNGRRDFVEKVEILKKYEAEYLQMNNKKYSETRDREYLLEAEVTAMMKAAKKGRWGHRDSTLILMGYRHGLRISELVNLRWQQVDFKTGHLHVKRIKGSRPSVHPIAGDELRSLRELLRQQQKKKKQTKKSDRSDIPSESPFLFLSERGGPMTADAARKLIRKAGETAGLQFPVHPHMLRHGCGYYLAAKGIDTRAIQDYLGHANIHHTVRYTQLAPQRFEGFWEN
jgi:type 1 fimbriae regulatory protein FimB/type 1 fimbriae regulatory protein FimE